MVEKRTSSPIQSHTEYTYTRFRCPGCGNCVPDERTRSEGTLCANCREGR